MPSRVDNLEKRKKKVIRKSLSKMKKAGEAGKEKKMDRVAKRGDKKLKTINKKIDKSMARQEERGMRKAKRQKINDYTKGVKTSGMRKKAKADREKIKAERKETRTRIRAKNKRRRQEYIESGDRKRDVKALPQLLAKAYAKDLPKAALEEARKAATGTKELVQKGVKAAGKGAKKVVSKVKNRKKKNR